MPRPFSDSTYLRRALRLAARGRYGTSPNPMVGALVVQDGEVIASGYHAQVGGPHAEAVALAAAGDSARGATLYVTLEPCSHHGRTPPCSAAILAAGIRRVVACHRDPNPDVSGHGFEVLRRAGVAVEWGLHAREAVRLNWRFLTATIFRRPAVTLKWAMSLDGRIATVTGESQWISSPAGRRWGLGEREEHDAILVGSGTVLADDPRLDRRLGRASGPNVRVILDRRLRTPVRARLFDLAGDVLIYTQAAIGAASQALAERGANVIRLPVVAPGPVLADLFQRGIQSVLVEGGGGVHASFVAAGTFDRVAVDCAPLLIGGATAPGPVLGEGFQSLKAAPRLAGFGIERRGGDVILSAFRESCLPDLYASVAA